MATGNSHGHNMAIKDLPILIRPREKAERYGITSLSDVELLAIIINSGNKSCNAIDISYELISSFNGLYNLSSVHYSELKKIKGISKVKGLQLMALFTLFDRIQKHQIEDNEIIINNDYIYLKYSNYFNNSHQEELVVIVLSRSKRILFETSLFKGSNDSVSFSIKEILKTVIIHEGYYFYLLHNHPSGTLEPSEEDMLLTMKIIYQARKLDLYLIDHLIITSLGYTSIIQQIEKKKGEKKV